MSQAIQAFKPKKPIENDYWKALGITKKGRELYAQLAEGFAYSTFRELATIAGLERKELSAIISIPQVTLQRRAKAGRFNTDESDRIYRFAQLNKATYDLFEGDTVAAKRWLHDAVKGLGGKKPIEMLGTSAEFNAVLDLIGQLEHGINV